VERQLELDLSVIQALKTATSGSPEFKNLRTHVHPHAQSVRKGPRFPFVDKTPFGPKREGIDCHVSGLEVPWLKARGKRPSCFYSASQYIYFLFQYLAKSLECHKGQVAYFRAYKEHILAHRIWLSKSPVILLYNLFPIHVESLQMVVR